MGAVDAPGDREGETISNRSNKKLSLRERRSHLLFSK